MFRVRGIQLCIDVIRGSFECVSEICKVRVV